MSINFLETFFFISLAITFVLILLLVYHFKQRITAIEQKSDTLFDIIQNLAKELTMLRAQQHMVNSNMPMFFNSNVGNMMPENLCQPNSTDRVCEDDEETDHESDADTDECDDSDSDSDGDAESDNEGVDEYDNDQSDNEDAHEPVIKKIVVNDDIVESELVSNLEEFNESPLNNENMSQIEEVDLDNEIMDNKHSEDESKELYSVNTDSYKKMNLVALNNLGRMVIGSFI